MKKILYIILVAAVLTATSAYVKKHAVPRQPEEQTAVTAAISASSATEMSKDKCVCDSECLCEENDTECDCTQTKSVCSCEQENGQVITVESVDTNIDEIEELDHEETSDEEETILQG